MGCPGVDTSVRSFNDNSNSHSPNQALLAEAV